MGSLGNEAEFAYLTGATIDNASGGLDGTWMVELGAMTMATRRRHWWAR